VLGSEPAPSHLFPVDEGDGEAGLARRTRHHGRRLFFREHAHAMLEKRVETGRRDVAVAKKISPAEFLQGRWLLLLMSVWYCGTAELARETRNFAF
jgi:hypothetical protein